MVTWDRAREFSVGSLKADCPADVGWREPIGTEPGTDNPAQAALRMARSVPAWRSRSPAHARKTGTWGGNRLVSTHLQHAAFAAGKPTGGAGAQSRAPASGD